MLILFAIGTGAIRGFAITISIGILISMFTAIVLVRLLISHSGLGRAGTHSPKGRRSGSCGLATPVSLSRP